MIIIKESEMEFGPFEENEVFQIEKSNLYKAMRNTKVVVFILQKESALLYFVEAKSSSPRPVPDNKDKFDEFITEIVEKFLHSINLCHAALFKRHENANDMPESIKDIDASQMKIVFVLVINGHSIDWLPPLQVALERRLQAYSSIWDVNVAVLNDSLDQERHLVR